MGKTPFIDFRGTLDNELHMKKKAGTAEEEKADPDNVWNPGLHSYDPDWGEEPLQKTKSIQYTEFIAPMMKAIQELSAKVDALEKA